MPSPTGSSPTVATQATGNPNVDALLYGTQWASHRVSYSFINPGSVFAPGYNPALTGAVQGLTAAQQASFTALASSLSNYANISLVPAVETPTQVGDIRIGYALNYSWNNIPARELVLDGSAAGGDIWLNLAGRDNIYGAFSGNYSTSSFTPGSISYAWVMWGLFSALGMTDASVAGKLVPYTLDNGYNSTAYTIMGNWDLAQVHNTTGTYFYPTTPMPLDIAALQAMYGANMAYNAGDTVYSFTDAPGQYYNQTIWDGGGNNTISYTGSIGAYIDLRAGQGSELGNKVWISTAADPHAYAAFNVWIAYGVHIDSAVVNSSTRSYIQGNDDGNTMTGGSGGDTFMGGGGNDMMRGNAGDDSLSGGGGADTAVYGGKLADYTVKFGAKASDPVKVTDTRKIADNDGTDTLTSVERVRFADVGIAYDMAATDVAGKTALVMGATLGPVFTLDKSWAGVFLKYFDSGATVLQGAQLLVDAGIMSAFAGGTDNTSFVKFVYNNVYGQAPDAATLASLVAPLNAHTTTQAQWMADMALSAVNQQHVNLVGLAASGWQYTP